MTLRRICVKLLPEPMLPQFTDAYLNETVAQNPQCTIPITITHSVQFCNRYVPLAWPARSPCLPQGRPPASPIYRGLSASWSNPYSTEHCPAKPYASSSAPIIPTQLQTISPSCPWRDIRTRSTEIQEWSWTLYLLWRGQSPPWFLQIWPSYHLFYL